jgi:hypothetical protein
MYTYKPAPLPPIRLISTIIPRINLRRLNPAPPPRMRISNRQPPWTYTRAIRASPAHAPIITIPWRLHLIHLIAVAALYAHEMAAIALDEPEPLLLGAGRGFPVATALAAVTTDRTARAARAGFRVAAVAVEDVVEGELALCLVGRRLGRVERVVGVNGRELGELDVCVVRFV